MSATEATPVERVQTSFKQLSLAAVNLNVASSELCKTISVLDNSLLKLNLGISAWAHITGNQDEDMNWWSREIGYTQIKGVWCTALRSSRGNYNYDERDSETSWAFSEAPRWMQVEGIAKLPDLIEKLIAQAEETRKKLKNKSALALDLVAAIEEVAKQEQDWQAKLATAMQDAGLPELANAMLEPEVQVAVIDNQLKFKLPKRVQDLFDRDAVESILSRLGYPDLPFKFTFVKDQKTGDQVKGAKQ